MVTCLQDFEHGEHAHDGVVHINAILPLIYDRICPGIRTSLKNKVQKGHTEDEMAAEATPMNVQTADAY